MLNEDKQEVDWAKVKRKRRAKLLLVLIGPFLVPYLLFGAFEIISAKVNLWKWDATLESQGIPTSLEEGFTKPPPADQNFGALPIFAALVDYEGYDFENFEIVYNESSETVRDRLNNFRSFHLQFDQSSPFRPEKFPFDWKAMAEIEELSVSDYQETIDKYLSTELAALLEELKPGIDLPLSQFPYPSDGDKWFCYLHPNIDLDELVELLILRYGQCYDQRDETGALETIKMLIQLIRLRASQGPVSPGWDIDGRKRLFEETLVLGIESDLFTQSSLEVIAKRMGSINLIEQELTNLRRAFVIAPKVLQQYDIGQLIDQFVDAMGGFGIPFEEPIIQFLKCALPVKSYLKNNFLSFLDGANEYVYLRLASGDPSPMPTSIPKNFHNLISHFLVEEMVDHDVANEFFERQTKINLMATAYRVKSHYVKTGEIPIKVDGGFDDFYNKGHQLNIKKTNKGFTVYSYGVDRKDDGGKGDDIDIVIRLTD